MRARLDALSSLTPDNNFQNNPFGTLPSYSVLIKRALRDQAVPDTVLRLIIQLSDDFGQLSIESDQRLFLQEPSTTGLAEYDALLAGLAVHLCRGKKLETCPIWVFKPNRYLTQLWWYGMAGEIPTLRTHAFQQTPSCMRVRGVIFSAANLASV